MDILGVCTEIEREDPDAVFLQEVVPESLTILESKMTNYKCVQAGGEGYFVVILLKKATGEKLCGSTLSSLASWSSISSHSNFLMACVPPAYISLAAYEDHCIEPYGQSRMGRNLLMVKCRIRNIPVLLMTSHLESMKNHEAGTFFSACVIFDFLTVFASVLRACSF